MACSKPVQDEIRILLIGKTGVGKSATGNTLLGSEVFNCELSFDSETRKTERHSECSRFGKKITVIDSPGLFDTSEDVNNDDILHEIKKAFVDLTPGPHAVILVNAIGRFGKLDKETAEIFLSLLDEEKVLPYFFMVFTGADKLKETTFIEVLKKSKNTFLHTTLQKCQGKYMAIDNLGENKEDYAKQMIDMIEKAIVNNGGGCFSNPMFKEIVRSIKETGKTKEEIQHEIEQNSVSGWNFLTYVTYPIWKPFDMLKSKYSAIRGKQDSK